MFDCGPLGDGGHGHYDLLNIEIAANGRPLIVDPGRYTYDEGSPNWRHWFKGTAAHNTVCVDGLDQTPYRRGKPKKHIAQGRFVRRLSAPGFDLLSGEVVSSQYDAIHSREVIFVADEYWLIADHLRGERPHRYDLRFHLAPEAWDNTHITTNADQTAVHAPGVTLLFPVGTKVTLEPGWVAPTYGEKLSAPIVSVIADGQASAEFLTLVVPHNVSDPLPTVHDVTITGGSSPRVLEVHGVGPDHMHRDRLTWSPTLTSLTVGSLHCRAGAAWVRESAKGEGLTFRACQVTQLTWVAQSRSAALTTVSPCDWVQWDPERGMMQGQRETL